MARTDGILDGVSLGGDILKSLHDRLESGVGGSLILVTELSVELVESLVILELLLVVAQSIVELGEGLGRGDGNSSQNFAVGLLLGKLHTLQTRNVKIRCIVQG